MIDLIIQENVSLKPFTTFQVGGPARYFVTVSTPESTQAAIRWASQHAVRFFVIAGGSNVLIPDSGFDGLVIKPEFFKLSIDTTAVTVGAGVTLADLIEKTLAAGFTGLEFAAGVPGTVGGAIRGNAGTYGKAMSDVVQSVLYVEGATGTIKTRSTSECGFAYRQSIFKQTSDIIVQGVLQLTNGAVADSRAVIEERITIRQTTHPLEPSAGCIFKNVEFSRVDHAPLRAAGLDITRFERYQKIPTGFLVEQLDLKGKQIGGAQISPKHGNYIINTGIATFEDVITLISYIKQHVRDAYNIQLEEEVHIVH